MPRKEPAPGTPMCRDWPPARIRRFTEAWHAGKTLRQIGEAEGLGFESAVTRIARRLGLPRRGPVRDPGRRPWTEEEEREVERLRLVERLSLAKISKRLDRTVGEIEGALARRRKAAPAPGPVQPDTVPTADPARLRGAGPLPIGHPLSWSLIARDPYPGML